MKNLKKSIKILWNLEKNGWDVMNGFFSVHANNDGPSSSVKCMLVMLMSATWLVFYCCEEGTHERIVGSSQ